MLTLDDLREMHRVGAGNVSSGVVVASHLKLHALARELAVVLDAVEEMVIDECSCRHSALCECQIQVRAALTKARAAGLLEEKP